MHPLVLTQIVDQHIAELRSDAAQHRLVRQLRPGQPAKTTGKARRWLRLRLARRRAALARSARQTCATRVPRPSGPGATGPEVNGFPPAPQASRSERGWIPTDGGDIDVIRAEALFVSYLQPSQRPTPHQVQDAIATTLRRLGTGGCAAAVAEEFGAHPDTAATRMTWARTTLRAGPGPVPAAPALTEAA